MAWPLRLVRTVSCFQWPAYVSGSYAEYGVDLRKPQVSLSTWCVPVPAPYPSNCQGKDHTLCSLDWGLLRSPTPGQVPTE